MVSVPKKYKYNTSFRYDGRTYYVHADTKRELGEKIANKKAEVDKGKWLHEGNTTVEDWARNAVATYKINQSAGTKKNYNYMMETFVLPDIGKMKLKDVRRMDCQQVLNEQSGRSKSQVEAVRQILKFIFRTAVEDGLILKSPADGIITPKFTQGKRRAITFSERYHLLRCYLKDNHYVLFLLMLYCGCRPEEACECKGNDIQKLGDANVLHIRGTKTANSDRMVPIPDVLYKRIRDTDPDDYIATNSAGRHHSESSYKRLRERLYRDMNISMGCETYRNALIPPFPLAEDFVPYCLRHTFCTHCAEIGLPLVTTQRLMGHADIRMTANVYSHVGDTLIQDADRIINGKK